MRKILPVILIIGIVLVFFWQFLVKGLVLIPADSLVGLYHPFRDYLAKEFPRGYPFKNFLITDPVLQQYPWRELAINLEKNGQLPSWNPYSGAGEPLLANIQSAAFYPLNIIFFILPFIQSWMVLLMLQMFLGGIFTFLFLKNLRLRNESSLFGCMAFILSGFYFVWLSWNNLLQVFLWLPLTLMSIDKIVFAKTAKAKICWAFVLFFSLSAALLAGHLQVFFYSFVLSLCYFIYRLYSSKEKIKTTLIALISTTAFLIVTAFQWLPTFSLISLSSRAIDQLNWQRAGWFIPWQHLIQFISPDFFGNPTTLNYWGTWNYAELIGYVGIFTLAFAALTLFIKKEKTVIFFLISLLVAVVFAFPNLISRIPFELQLPLISSSQPTRLMMVIDFSLVVLSAFGVEEFLKKRQIKKLIYISFSFLIILVGVWVFVILNKSKDASLIISQRNLYLPSIIIIVQAIIFSLAFLFKQKRKIFLAIFYVILLINILDLMHYGLKFNPFVSTSLIYPNTKITKFLQNQSKNYPWRFMGADYVQNEKRIFPPNVADAYQLYAIDDYNPLLIKNYQNYIVLSEWGFKNASNFSFNRMIIPNNYNTRLIDLLGVKYIVTINSVNSKKLKFLFNEGDARVYENTNVFERAFIVYSSIAAKSDKDWNEFLSDSKINLKNTAIVNKQISLNGDGFGKVEFREYSANNIVMEVETSTKGILVLTDNYYPGWQATIDGLNAEVLRVDSIFRGIVVNPGKHLIKFKFNLL